MNITHGGRNATNTADGYEIIIGDSVYYAEVDIAQFVKIIGCDDANLMLQIHEAVLIEEEKRGYK